MFQVRKPVPLEVEDFWSEVSRIAEAELQPAREFLLRHGIVFAACIALYVAGTGVGVLVWYAVYFVSARLYLRSLRKAKGPIYLTGYLWVLGKNLALSMLFLSLPIYLFMVADPLVQFACGAGVVGKALYDVTHHGPLRHILWIDAVTMSSAILFMGGTLIYQGPGTLGHVAVIGVCTVSVAVYFVQCLVYVSRTRSVLTRTEEQLAQAQKMEAVGRLTGGVAHDFNNLLTVILGNLDLYQELYTTQERDAAVGEARDAATRAAKVTAQLLAFSRKSPLTAEPVRVESFINEFSMLAKRVVPSSIQLSIQYPEELPRLYLDKSKLETALLNLVINARDAMGPEPGALEIMVERRMVRAGWSTLQSSLPLEPGMYCRFTVTDTGPGIPLELLDQIAEPFFTTKPVGKGSGLGLSMAKGFAEQSGGALGVTSTTIPPNTGTTVEILLPFPNSTPDQLEEPLPFKKAANG